MNLLELSLPYLPAGNPAWQGSHEKALRLSKKLIILILMVLGGATAFAQNNLSVTGVNFQWPDTIVANDSASFIVHIQNDSATTYTDTLLLQMWDDSAGGFVLVETFDFGSVVINGFDTTSVAVNHTFLSSRYSPGNNVVVIWPVNGAGEQGDSLQLNVFVIFPDDIGEIDLADYITVFPNPIDAEVNILDRLGQATLSYRIYGSSGKLVESGRVLQPVLDVSQLSPGSYILELYANELRTTIRLIKK